MIFAGSGGVPGRVAEARGVATNGSRVIDWSYDLGPAVHGNYKRMLLFFA